MTSFIGLVGIRFLLRAFGPSTRVVPAQIDFIHNFATSPAANGQRCEVLAVAALPCTYMRAGRLSGQKKRISDGYLPF
jgi:hypothetical protein